MDFSDALKSLRKKNGLSQKELADKAGVSQTAIYHWENGMRKPKTEQLLKLANALNVSPSDLGRNFLMDELFNTLESYASKIGVPFPDETDEEIHELNEDYIISLVQKLNIKGQIRLLDHIEDLLKIAEYKKNSE